MGAFFNKVLKEFHKLPESKALEKMRKERNVATVPVPVVKTVVEDLVIKDSNWRTVNLAKARAARKAKRGNK